jgi:serine/threonine protein kinase
LQNLQSERAQGVISFIKQYKTQKARYLITEYCCGGDLSSLFKAKGGRLKEVEAQLIMKKILQGLGELHSSGIIHRDLKPDNIFVKFEMDTPQSIEDILSYSGKRFLASVDLLTANFQIKIGDLGFSKYVSDIHQMNSSICGTPLYMSP